MDEVHRYRYAIVGNCSYIAYITPETSLSWLCWPRPDDSFVFGQMLDEAGGGWFRLVPRGDYTSRQRYLTNTNVLSTTLEGEDWAMEVIDFAPRFAHHDRHFKPLQFFRVVRRLRGTPRLRVECRPRGQYGMATPTVLEGSNHLSYAGLHVPLRLTTNAPKTHVQHEREFALGEDLYFVLSCGEPFEAPLRETAESFLQKTIRYWRDWVKGTYVPPIFQEEMVRAALTLKIHQYEDTGAILAAGTTSLPEFPGHGRNWDYRYCWVRDTYFSLAALNGLGHFWEAEKYSQFLLGLTEDFRDLPPVFRLDGSREMPERVLGLPGYRGEGPVRVGNQAAEQIQTDVYAELVLSLEPLYNDARLAALKTHPSLEVVQHLVSSMEATVRVPDAGIWEYRGRRGLHVGTTIFHWAGAVAAEKIARMHDDESLGKAARRVRDEAERVIESCWRPEPGVFASQVGSDDLDASAFLLVTMGYLRPDDPRARPHVENLAAGLRSPAGFIHRYRALDDFGETHASFLICHFWYAECLAMLGDLDASEAEIRRLLATANHVGLMSEDVDAVTGAQWGNFPQTYSHVGLINAVNRLARRRDLPSWWVKK